MMNARLLIARYASILTDGVFQMKNGSLCFKRALKRKSARTLETVTIRAGTFRLLNWISQKSWRTIGRVYGKKTGKCFLPERTGSG